MHNYQLENIKHFEMVEQTQTTSKIGNIAQKNDDDDDNQSIGKFLSLSDRKRLSNIEEQVPNLQIQSQIELHSQSQLSDKKYKPKRSPLHNFQKHFVTTLRRNVRVRQADADQKHLKAAHEIWDIFKASKKYTKQLVYIVLGLIDAGSEQLILTKYGLQKIFQNYGCQQFRQAQNFLRQRVSQTFRQVSTEKIMYERRIEKKKQFTNYFYKILGQIEQGSTKKRLPKRKKMTKRNSTFALQ